MVNKPKKSILEKEFASVKKDWGSFAKYQKSIANPDPILKSTKLGMEKGIELFSEMKRDAHISAALQIRKRAVLKYSFYILPASDKEVDEKNAEFLQEELKKIYYNLAGYILDAVPMGVSFTEVMYKVTDLVRIKTVKKRKQKRFTFDSEGNHRLKTSANYDGEEIPDNKIIVATYEEEDDNKYGEAVLSNCFWSWWFKKHGILFYANYLERHGQPFLVGKYPPCTKKDKREKLLEAIEAIQTDFGVIIPEAFTIELIEAATKGATDSYKLFLEYMDRQLSKAIISSTLTIDEAEHGTRAQAEVHQEISTEVIDADIRFLEMVINQTILTWMTEWNVNTDRAPEISILSKQNEATKEDMEKLKIISVDMGAPIPWKYILEKNKIPIPVDGDQVLVNGELRIMGEENRPNIKPDINNFSEWVDFAESFKDDVDKYFDKVYEETFKKGFDKDLNLGKLEKNLSKSKDIKSALKILNNHKTKEGQYIKDLLLLGELVGLYVPDKQDSSEFADDKVAPMLDIDMDKLFTLVESKEAIEYIKKKIPVAQKEWNLLSDEAKNAAFYIQNTSKLVVINGVKEALLRALEEGIPFSQIKKDVADIFKKANVKGYNEGYLKTVFYTNVYSAYNAGRYKQLMSDENTEWLKYVTAGDDFVRAEHAKLHGFIAKKDDPIWDTIWPPNDFGCRCKVIMLRKSEIPEDGIADKAKGKPAEGFANNPAKVNRQALVDSLKKQKKYSKYLDNAIDKKGT
jgi:SPP1 gp7 family putative phage head morphogenesis protein